MTRAVGLGTNLQQTGDLKIANGSHSLLFDSPAAGVERWVALTTSVFNQQ
jgi:hypothetical protein